MWQIITIILVATNILTAIIFFFQLRTVRKANQNIADSLEKMQTEKHNNPPPNILETISTSIGTVLFALDTNLHFIYINSQITTMSGHSQQFCLNSPIMCLLSTETYIELKRLIEKPENNKIIELLGQLVSPSNQLISVSIKIKKSICPETGKIYWAGSIDTPKLHSDEINSDKNVYRQVMERADTNVIIADIEGVIVQINQSFSQKIGYTPQEIIGHRVQDFQHQILPNYRELWDNIKHGIKWRGEYQIQSKNGQKYWSIINATPLKNPNGDYSHFCAYIEDITLIINKYRSLENTSKILHNQVEMRDKMFSLISHDLRNSVGNLRNISMLQIQEFDTPDTNISMVKKYSEIINDCSSSTYSILENLLVWAKSQFLHQNKHNEIIDVEDLINRNIELLLPQAKQKNITLESIAGNFTEVFADMQALNAILRNLIVNAIKFTEPDGKITLFINTAQDENFAEIAVADTGVGLTEEQKQSIFGNSPQLKSTIGTSNEKGTGLGLMLCLDFVKSMGGKIWVEDNKPKGTVFKFTIPFA